MTQPVAEPIPEQLTKDDLEPMGEPGPRAAARDLPPGMRVEAPIRFSRG